MTQTASSSGRFQIPDALAGAISLTAQLCIGLLLVLFAGMLAVMTAFAGVLLGAAALVMRFAGRRRAHARSASGPDAPLTLEARRTPRGWTVE
ncbi:hypothetical protein [Hyphomonas sp.]|jgi:polyferredoxin|uniref:hypothetical protein n=1 Tax=Hyphomonas sp. TaxID=87 RepID=UPI000411A9BA|nr:hypothetical protein [Hyphomonas sp.]